MDNLLKNMYKKISNIYVFYVNVPFGLSASKVAPG